MAKLSIQEVQAKATPDMLTINQMLKRLLEAAPKICHKLF